jgi:hypothetical protein
LPALPRSSRAAFALALALLATSPARAVAPFTLELVDSNPLGSVGESSSMKVDHLGHPHIAYYDAVNGNLKYASHDGANWIVETADGSPEDVGEFCALALDSLDRPYIAYYDDTHQRLMYTAKLGAAWTREIADTASFDCGWYPTIAIDRTGRAWIASYDRGAGNPRVSVRNPGGGWTGQYLDTTFALSGFYASIAIDPGGTPHVGYYDLSGKKLVYATQRRSGPNLVWVQETADSSADDVGIFSSLAVDRFGRVEMAYMDLTTADLKWAIRDPVSGHWSRAFVHSGIDEVGYNCSLAIDPIGYPLISYHNGTAGTLMLARRDAGGWHRQTVDDSPGIVGLYSSVGTDAQGDYRISYWDGSARTLKFAWGPSVVLTGVPPVTIAAPRLSVAPNPARAGARVRFLVGDPDVASVEVMDIAGRRVAKLALGSDHAAEWDQRGDGGALPPGVYLARARYRDGSHGAMTRLILIR